MIQENKSFVEKYTDKELRAFLLDSLEQAQSAEILTAAKADKALYSRLVYAYEGLVMDYVDRQLSRINEQKVKFIDAFLGLNAIQDYLDLCSAESAMESVLALEGRSAQDWSVRDDLRDAVINTFYSLILARRSLLGMLSEAEAGISIKESVLVEAEADLVFDFAHGYLVGDELHRFNQYYRRHTPDAQDKINAEAGRLTLLQIDWTQFKAS